MKKKSLYPSPGCRKIIHFLVMKASFIFLLLLTLQIKANVYAQQLRLDLNLQNATLKEVIQEIRRFGRDHSTECTNEGCNDRGGIEKLFTRDEAGVRYYG